jgi:uncharacterized protein YjbI with pentapeptide repeats
VEIRSMSGELIFQNQTQELTIGDLDDQDLREADLRGFEFGGILITGAMMSRANLTGANLYWCVLIDVDFSEANL